MTSTRTRLLGIALAIAAPLGFAACGGGDGGGTSPQDGVADLLIEVINEQLGGGGIDFELDEQCVRDLTDQLSDADAQAIVDAGVDGEPDTSAEADAIGEQIETCLSVGAGG